MRHSSHGFATLVCLLGALAGHTFAQMRGVNIGGWLVTEEWMTPSLYANTSAADEWHLCNELGKDACTTLMEAHWSTFYTRDDFLDIKNAGLNTLRIPIGYWAVDLLDYEPYVSGQFPYLIQAVQWAKEIGLSVLISLHGAPGSQNGAETSGLIGPVLFATNTSNIDRTIAVLKNFTTEFSKEIYGGTVASIELLNEPYLYSANFTIDQLRSFYTNATEAVHGINSTMDVVIADGFYGPALWENYNPVPADPTTYVTLDAHQFYAFTPLNTLTREEIITHVCSLSELIKQNASVSGIPTTIVGEWSLQTGVSLNDTNGLPRDTRTWLRMLFEAQVQAYSSNGNGQSAAGWIFWAWKTEDDYETWSYRRGISSEWIPVDVSNSSLFVYPVDDLGCINASYPYQAPATVPVYDQSVWDHNSTTSSSTTSSSSGSASSDSAAADTTKKAGAVSLGSASGALALLCAFWTAIAMA